MLKALLVSTAIALAALPAYAQQIEQMPAEPGQTAEQMAAAPANFVSDAASIGMAEVTLGQLAAQKAQSQEVKEFGRNVADAHTANNQKLQTAATQAGVQIPQQPQSDEQAAIQRLSGLSGAEFDRAFVEHMVQAHRQAVDLYQTQAQAGTNPALQNYARETLPALQQHLQKAQQLQSKTAG